MRACFEGANPTSTKAAQYVNTLNCSLHSVFSKHTRQLSTNSELRLFDVLEVDQCVEVLDLGELIVVQLELLQGDQRVQVFNLFEKVPAKAEDFDFVQHFQAFQGTEAPVVQVNSLEDWQVWQRKNYVWSVTY